MECQQLQDLQSNHTIIPSAGLEEHFFNRLSEGLIYYKALRDEYGSIVDLLFVDINSSAIQLVGKGWQKEDLIGKSAREVLGEDLESDLPLFMETNKTGKPNTTKRFFRNTEKWFLQRVEKLDNDYFAVIFFEDSYENIEDNEFKLIQSLLYSIINSSDNSIIARDLNERLILINDKESEILKIAKKLALGKTPYDLYTHEIADKIVENDKQILKEGKVCRLRERIPIDEDLHYFDVNKFPLKDNNGNIFGVGVIKSEIAEGREAKQGLKRYEELLEKMFNQAGIGVAIMGLDGRISVVNSAYQRITGYTEQEIKSKGSALFTCYRDAKEETSLIQEVDRQISDGYALDRRVICKGGFIKWVHLTGSALLSGKKRGILITMEDITTQKMNEIKREKQSRALEDLLQQRTTELLNAKRDALVTNAAGLVGQQLLLKYIFRKSPEDIY